MNKSVQHLHYSQIFLAIVKRRVKCVLRENSMLWLVTPLSYSVSPVVFPLILQSTLKPLWFSAAQKQLIALLDLRVKYEATININVIHQTQNVLKRKHTTLERMIDIFTEIQHILSTKCQRRKHKENNVPSILFVADLTICEVVFQDSQREGRTLTAENPLCRALDLF